MVVCKCRKATRLYCFVHKVPVCGECICFSEHHICVVKKYSDWVVDGEYDWPPTCSLCHAALEAGHDSETTRLGCLHLMHTNCLVSHIQSFPPQTAPSGYVCPECLAPIWPPKSIKDTGSRLHSRLKEAIVQSGLDKNVFGSYLVSVSTVASHGPPPAFASEPLMRVSAVEDGDSSAKEESNSSGMHMSAFAMNSSKFSEPDIIEVDASVSLGNQFIPKDQEASFLQNPGATTRKGAYQVDRQNSETSYYADDEDGTHKKYSRRGSFRHKFLRMLLPFWSSALPTLPVTAPPRKDGTNADAVPEGRVRHQRSSRMDPRKILFVMAIMASMATMGILYYRLAQRIIGENLPEDEHQ